MGVNICVKILGYVFLSKSAWPQLEGKPKVGVVLDLGKYGILSHIHSQNEHTPTGQPTA